MGNREGRERGTEETAARGVKSEDPRNWKKGWLGRQRSGKRAGMQAVRDTDRTKRHEVDLEHWRLDLERRVGNARNCESKYQTSGYVSPTCFSQAAMFHRNGQPGCLSLPI